MEDDDMLRVKQGGFVLTSEELNDNSCTFNANCVWWSVKNSNVELVKKFLEGGGDPNSTN